MKLSELINSLNARGRLKAVLNRDADVHAVLLLPEDPAGMREDALYFSTDYARISAVAAMPFSKNLLCLCDPDAVPRPDVEAHSNLISADPGDVLELFSMRDRLHMLMTSAPEMRTQALEHLIRSENMEDTLKNGREYLMHGFAIFDGSLQLVGDSGFEERYPAKLTQQLIEKQRPFERSPHCRSYNTEAHAIRMLRCTPGEDGNQVLLCEFYADKLLFGYMAIDYEGAAITEPDMERTAVYCSMMCKVLLSMQHTRAPANAAEPFLIRLLETRISRKAAETGAKRFGWQLARQICALTAYPIDGRDAAEDLWPKLHQLLNVLPSARGLIYHRQIVVLFSSAEPMDRGSDLWHILREAVHDLELMGGVSRRFSELHTAKTYYEQSVAALQLARELSLDDCLHFFEDMGLYALLAATPDEETLSRQIHPGVPELIAYDKKHGTELYETLTCYMDCLGDYSKAAERLFVHRNTIKYRIAKAEELLGLSLAEPAGYQTLLLSLGIMDYLARKNGREPVID